MVRDALAFSMAAAVGVVYFRAAIIITSLVASAYETGLFGAAFRIVDVIIVVPALIVGAGFPIFSRAARDDHARLAYALQRTFEASLVLGGAIALGLALGASLAIDIVAGAKFAGAESVLRIQTIALLCAFASAAWGYGMLSLRLHRQALFVTVTALALNAALTLALVPGLGADGAAIAVACGEAFVAVAEAVILWRQEPELGPRFGRAARVGVALGLGGAVALIPDLPVAVLVALGLSVYVVALLALRAIPEEVIVEGRRFLAARRGAASA
jgi:O-antigen/teichoic acid export membrane protein